MSFWAYILRCADNSYYTGHTDNLEQRIGEHQNGLCGGYTALRLPVELAFSQECATSRRSSRSRTTNQRLGPQEKGSDDARRLGGGIAFGERCSTGWCARSSFDKLRTNGERAVSRLEERPVVVSPLILLGTGLSNH
ncbi:MAG TPA: GIY-YIG nuclease family protein [Gallionella sp.]|nr:GIY-YIG nuclease family protein [Gallionella sp.]